MKRFIYLFPLLFIICITNVDASSIEYNLEIDKTMQFYETIVYRIENKDVQKSNEYDFLTSVVNDPVYFNKSSNVIYNKTVSKTNDGYVVTLKHNYSSMFFQNSRISKECFSGVELTNDSKGLRFKSTSPFFCYSRADSIIVNIKTDLRVIGSNATSVNGNVYTWNNINRDFTLNFSTSMISIDSEPLDDDGDTSSNEDNSENSDNNVTDDADDVKEQKQTKITYIALVSIVGGFLLLGLLSFVILQKRNKDLNSI